LAEQIELHRAEVESLTSRETSLSFQLAEQQILSTNQATREAQYLSRIAELQARVTALATNSQSELQNVVAANEAQSTHLMESHRADATTRDAAHAMRISELNALITSLTAIQRELKARVESQEEALRVTEERSAAQLRTIDALKMEHNTVLQSLEVKVTTLKERCSDLLTTIDALRQTIAALTSERDTVRMSLNADMATLERRCAILQTSLTAEREEHATAVKRLLEQLDELSQVNRPPALSPVAPTTSSDHSLNRAASLSYDNALALLIASETQHLSNMTDSSSMSAASPEQPNSRSGSVNSITIDDGSARVDRVTAPSQVGANQPASAQVALGNSAARDLKAKVADEEDLLSVYTWTHHPHARPSSLTVDPDDGALYVCHEEHHVCEKWSSYPQAELSGRSHASSAAPSPSVIQWVFGTQAQAGNTKALLNGPVACVVDPWNRELYILDSGNHRVVVVQLASGSFVRSIGESIFGASVLHFPKSIAVCRQEPLPTSPVHAPQQLAPASSKPSLKCIGGAGVCCHHR